MQLLPSTRQVETLVLVAQNEPAAPAQSAGGASQPQAAFGFEPVQLSCAGHAAVDCTKKQPLESAAHVEIEVPVAQSLAVAEPQLGSVLQLQVAEPATPVQPRCVPQSTAAPVAKKQPSLSWAHVVFCVPLEQKSPATVHELALHAQTGVPLVAEHAECVPQAASVPQTLQSPVPATQVWMPPPLPQRLAPSVQTF
jgi:hypothetical protein